ncbi:MAG: iron ABC transporter permease [Spirochaetales bacterium]|nr:iron ABC transporter permease [Spirochaetales bacterium]
MIEEYYRIERKRRIGAYLLSLLVLAVSVMYLSFGVVPVSFVDSIRILLGKWEGLSSAQVLAVEGIRLPRLITALLVGSGLAVSGAAYQGLFRNRLADPFVTGVSAGAVFGCTLAVLFGFQSGLWGLGGITLFAFLGALGTSVAVFLILGVLKRASSATILLIGISLNFFLSAVVSLLMFLNRNRIESIVLWTMGSVASANKEKVFFALPFFLIGMAGLFFFSRPLDYLSLGDDVARVHGQNVSRSRFLIILFASLVTSVCVSLSGVIGFIGLVTPNMARLIAGSRHRNIFLYSVLLGAVFFVGSDILAKTLLVPSEIPVGIITSLLGVPVFVALVLKSFRRIF